MQNVVFSYSDNEKSSWLLPNNVIYKRMSFLLVYILHRPSTPHENTTTPIYISGNLATGNRHNNTETWGNGLLSLVFFIKCWRFLWGSLNWFQLKGKPHTQTHAPTHPRTQSMETHHSHLQTKISQVFIDYQPYVLTVKKKELYFHCLIW